MRRFVEVLDETMNPEQPKRTIDERLDDIDAQLKTIRQLLN